MYVGPDESGGDQGQGDVGDRPGEPDEHHAPLRVLEVRGRDRHRLGPAQEEAATRAEERDHQHDGAPRVEVLHRVQRQAASGFRGRIAELPGGPAVRELVQHQADEQQRQSQEELDEQAVAVQRAQTLRCGELVVAGPRSRRRASGAADRAGPAHLRRGAEAERQQVVAADARCTWRVMSRKRAEPRGDRRRARRAPWRRASPRAARPAANSYSSASDGPRLTRSTRRRPTTSARARARRRPGGGCACAPSMRRSPPARGRGAAT